MKLFILTSLVTVVYCMPQQPRTLFGRRSGQEDNALDFEQPALKPIPSPAKIPNEWELEQNRNAHYQFSTNIDDKISDQTQQRSEVRDGLKVEGSYSYSDGYFKRTYHYVADDKGYRIVGTEVVPLEGPKVNLEGTASVDAAAHGTQLSYKVQSVPAVGQKIVDQFQGNPTN
ncbi:hypothetical protein HHI36_021818 [Cryptolaemus montrouzieri]|uniref:Cuticle protein n=1 Tax=Cryptolaemus montrouzieri TaxID=559131 RepID=A0ABD2MY89_9CUCU